MNYSSLHGANLIGIYSAYNTNYNLIKSLTAVSEEDTTSHSNKNNITNLNSYVANRLTSSSSDTIYTSELLKKNYNLSNLSNALAAIGNKNSFATLTNLNS